MAEQFIQLEVCKGWLGSFPFHLTLLPLFPLEDLKIYVRMLCNS